MNKEYLIEILKELDILEVFNIECSGKNVIMSYLDSNGVSRNTEIQLLKRGIAKYEI